LHSVRRLLLYKFADGPVQIAQLQPEELREFINQQLELRATASHAAALTSALRMYLRYRATRGDQVHALIGVIASPVQWRLATLPRALTRAQVDISVIALWLGHESPTNTHHYVEADLAMKDRALAKIQSPNARVRRYHAPDNLLQFLQTL
jgi:hypothetical protein